MTQAMLDDCHSKNNSISYLTYSDNFLFINWDASLVKPIALLYLQGRQHL